MIGDDYMLYCVKVTAPANTEKDKAVVKEVVIQEQVITQISVYFPPGHVCLTGVAVFYGEEQIFPHYEYDWLRGNGETVTGYVYYILPETPAKVKVKMFNEDTKYDHTVYVRIEALPIEIALWQYHLYALSQLFVDLYNVWSRPVRIIT